MVLNAQPALDPDRFGAFLAEQEDLSPKAWPSIVRLAEALPSTPTNKVLKRELIRQGLDFADPYWIRSDREREYRRGQ